MCRISETHTVKETEMDVMRYAAAACQTAMQNPLSRPDMHVNTDRMLSMIDSALAGSAPFLPVRLVVPPEFAHAAPVFPSVEELLEKLGVPMVADQVSGLAAESRCYRRLDRAEDWWDCPAAPSDADTEVPGTGGTAGDIRVGKDRPGGAACQEAATQELPVHDQTPAGTASAVGTAKAQRLASCHSRKTPYSC
jgi:hypothetical protein